MKNGFDNDKYLKIQSEHIKERIAKFGDKLYLEFGGKLFDDYHASRVLPGFQPDSKLRMLMQLADVAEIVIVISAVDIEKNKVRSDLGITYDKDVLRLRDEFQNRGLMVGSVVITHYTGQEAAKAFRGKLKKMGIKAYYHYTIPGYPSNVPLIASDEGFGKNDYIEKLNLELKSQNISLNENLHKIIEFTVGCLGNFDLLGISHAYHTSRYVLEICKKLRANGQYTEILTDEVISRFSLAALVHDIGKARVPQRIVNKVGKYTEDEYELMNCHAMEGRNMLMFLAPKSGK